MSSRRLSPAFGLLTPLALTLPLALFAIGCGGAGPQMGRVSGTVSHQGAPLTKGNITFVPSSPEGTYATSQIRPDGSYDLSTSEYGQGAVVGDYQVAVTDLAPEDIPDFIPREPVESKSQISPKYADISTSGLTATVKRGGNTFNFDLE